MLGRSTHIQNSHIFFLNILCKLICIHNLEIVGLSKETEGELLDTVEWDYPTFHLTMHCFICTLESDSFSLNEHNDAAWLTKDTLESIKWLPADLGLLDKIADIISN